MEGAVHSKNQVLNAIYTSGRNFLTLSPCLCFHQPLNRPSNLFKQNIFTILPTIV
jgi:hypothetical protein